jgi:hypothetical protein
LKPNHAARPSFVFASILALLATTSWADSGPNHRLKQTLPIKLGTSGGSAADASKAFCCGGTLGAAVMCNGALAVLSNNHVLGRSGAAATGEDAIQPGLIDVGCRANQANLVADYAGNLAPLGPSNVDAALSIARAGAVNSSGEILDVGVPCVVPKTATIGMPVAKSGRTSGFTMGTVQAVNATISVQYQKGCNSGKKFTVVFQNQVTVTPGSFLVSGDSGSLMVTNDASHQPAGLLFAGSSSIAVANPIEDVIDAFTPTCGGSFGFVGTACAANASVGLGAGPVTPDTSLASAVKERHVGHLMSDTAVLGVGVGASQGDPTTAAIVVYLEQGRSHRRLPDEIDGVPVEVVLTDRIVSRVGSCSD